MSSTSASPTLDRHTITGVIQPGDHEKLAHYACKNKIMEAFIEGTPVVALCGKVWVPTRDPERFPVCPECQDLKDQGFTLDCS